MIKRYRTSKKWITTENKNIKNKACRCSPIPVKSRKTFIVLLIFKG